MRISLERIIKSGIELNVIEERWNCLLCSSTALHDTRYYSKGDNISVIVSEDSVEVRGPNRKSSKYFTVEEFIDFFLGSEDLNLLFVVEQDYVRERIVVFYNMYYYLKNRFKSENKKIRFKCKEDLLKVNIRIKHYCRVKRNFIIRLTSLERNSFEVIDTKTMKSIFDEYSIEEIYLIITNQMFKKGICTNCGMSHKEGLVRKDGICVYCNYEKKGLY